MHISNLCLELIILNERYQFYEQFNLNKVEGKKLKDVAPNLSKS